MKPRVIFATDERIDGTHADARPGVVERPPEFFHVEGYAIFPQGVGADYPVRYALSGKRDLLLRYQFRAVRDARDGAIHVANNVGGDHGFTRAGRGFDENVSPPFVPVLEHGGFDALLEWP